ncbi:MAG: hypothetical protein ILNGONEN_00005 [Syntrophorhabdaceae bacterium]|nr:hypothetical protein [Syntrophorhabdaceae bacterium]
MKITPHLFGSMMSKKMPKNERNTTHSYVTMNTEVRMVGEEVRESDVGQ